MHKGVMWLVLQLLSQNKESEISKKSDFLLPVGISSSGERRKTHSSCLIKMPSSSVPNLRILCSVVNNAVNDQGAADYIAVSSQPVVSSPSFLLSSCHWEQMRAERLLLKLTNFVPGVLTDDSDSRTEMASIGRIDYKITQLGWWGFQEWDKLHTKKQKNSSIGIRFFL